MSKKSPQMLFYEINISQATYTAYKKLEMIKTGNQNREKSQMVE